MADDKLCQTGNTLWEESFKTNWEESIYRKYVYHIIECELCHEGLDLIDEDIEALKEFWNYDNRI